MNIELIESRIKRGNDAGHIDEASKYYLEAIALTQIEILKELRILNTKEY